MTMKFLAAAALLSSATTAHAGAIERSVQSITALFEKGRYVEFSFGAASPDTSGTGSAAVGGGSSGDMTPSFLRFEAAYKADINDQLSYAIIYDQPFGADVDYPSGTGYFAAGSKAEFESHALTGILRYKMPNNVSVYGGLRLQTIEASATVPFVSGYNVTGDRDLGIGYLAGVSYERPDIALRVSLTYNSKIKHELDTVETSVALGGPNSSVTAFETPQSVNLEFQTGVAADTLVFGGLRWINYSEFAITPTNYNTLTGGGSLVSYADDIYSYSFGVGRKLSETWSVAASVGYEKSNGGFVTNLGPTNGLKSFALAAIYTRDNMKVTTGIRYVNIGDAQTRAGAVAPAGIFTDNDAVAIGVKVGYTF